MENNQNILLKTRVTFLLKILFYINIAFVLIAVLLFQTGYLTRGSLVGLPDWTYRVQTTCILLTLGLVPTSLKLMPWLLKRALANIIEEADAIKRYQVLAIARLDLLVIPALMGVFTYYMTEDNLGLLCTGIAVLSLLFVFPSITKLDEEVGAAREEPTSNQ